MNNNLLLKILKFCIALLLIIPAIHHSHEFHKMIFKQSSTETYIRPFYGYMKTSSNLPFDASENLGADFSALFFSAKGYLQTGVMYNNRYDPWGRSAVTFPPHLIFITAKISQIFQYPLSLIFNNYVQIALFIFSMCYFLKQFHFLALALSLHFIFWSPVGLTWFERGQTDLYAASAIVLFLKAIRDQRKWDFWFAGVLLSFKWSAAPFFLFFGLVYLLYEKFETQKIYQKFSHLLIGIAPVLLLLLIFPKNSMDYLKLVIDAEKNIEPVGISIAFFLGPLLGKTLPLILALCFVALRHFRGQSQKGLAIIESLFIFLFIYLCCGYGSIAWEYRVMCLLAIIPMFFSKFTILNNPLNSQIPFPHTPFVTLFFVGLLMYGFRYDTKFFPINYVHEVINYCLNIKHSLPMYFSLIGVLLAEGIYLVLKFDRIEFKSFKWLNQ